MLLKTNKMDKSLKFVYRVSGALASLAEAADAEADGGRCHHLVSVPKNLESR